MSLVWISKPFILHTEEDAMLLSVLYLRFSLSLHLCVISPHFCCPISLFQGLHVACQDFTLTWPHFLIQYFVHILTKQQLSLHTFSIATEISKIQHHTISKAWVNHPYDFHVWDRYGPSFRISFPKILFGKGCNI